MSITEIIDGLMWKSLQIILFIMCFGTSSFAFAVTPEQTAKLSNGEIISEINKAENGVIDVYGAVDIATPPVNIWTIMRDCKAQLNIIPNLKSCNVLETSSDERWDKREQIIKLGFPLPNARSEFRSDYEPFRKIAISRTGGDLSFLKGEWTLQVLPSGKTRVTYQAQMKSRLPVPSSLIRRGVRRDMPRILYNLRAEAEARNQHLNP